MAGEVPWHFVRPNEASRYPRRIVTFDTEAYTNETRRGQHHRFRLACASFDLLPAGGGEPLRSERASFETPEALWAWIDKRTKSKGRLVCFAHNLAYDLRVGRGLECLPALGWRLEFLTLDGSKCVARYKRDSRSLILTDTMSYLPAALEKIAPLVGMVKPPLPSQAAPRAEWLERCETDTDITRAATLRLLGWLEANNCGSFRLTGPAQAMACYRHRFMERYSLLAHRDEEALGAERRAAWAGRCEVWRHGKISGPLFEWDYELAYLHLARTLYLPVALQGELQPSQLVGWRTLARHRRLLLECDVVTAAPVAPAALEGGIGWPVGSFSTTLWDVEAELLRRSGAKVTVTRAWSYKAWPALARWAEWLLGELGPDGLPSDALERLMLKHWARALVGRFGMRTPQFDRVAVLPESGLELLPFDDLETGERGAYLQAGFDWFERTGMVDAPDAMPAVMGYIMAACRVNLWNLCSVALPENVAYLDTDSVLVTEAGHAEIERWRATLTGPPLRLKGVYRRAELLAPRQILLDGKARMAGIPSKAHRVGERRFEAEVWEGLAESVRRGHPDEVRVRRVNRTVNGTDRRRRHLAGGQTAPLLVGVAGD